jgi:peptidyl-prolyl cis-trans isomerase-like 3
MAVTLHTNYGDMKVEIFCDTTAIASENFLGLCASGAYDGTLFHRNIKQFMIQGGDPTGTGKGEMNHTCVTLLNPALNSRLIMHN